jgi:putative oxidoreductase
MKDLGLLVLRASVGTLVAGHGAQKLFGAFEGPGLEGAAGWLESLGLKPGKNWALLAGLSEFGGGALTALGLYTPLGLLGITGAMSMATTTAHKDKPIWVTSGGAELPLTNLSIVAALALSGPGKLSLDHAFGIKVPRWFSLLGLAAVGAAVAMVATNGTADEAPATEQTEQSEEGEQESRKVAA